MIDFSNKKRIKDTKHWSAEINQLYHPTGDSKPDSEDLVYSFNNLNTTKFIPILLKEWFYILRKDGYLVIDYQPNKLCNFQELEEKMWWLWKRQYEIIYHGPIKNNDVQNLNKKKIFNYISEQTQSNTKIVDQKSKTPATFPTETISVSKTSYLRFICRKKVTSSVPDDSIDKWTIGIITNGKRLDWLEKIIQSIKDQKIPNYQIIVCGTYYDRKEPNFLYVPFNQRDDLGWITKKKNLIVENAKYENVCVMHDRMVLNDDWFKGMQKWGNCFEILGCRQLFEKERILDWITIHLLYFRDRDINKLYGFDSHLDYRDWYPNIRYFGPLNIFKKSLVVNNNLWWNETLYIKQKELQEGEEVDFSRGFPQHGFIQRFNPNSSVSTLAHKYPDPTFIQYDPKSLDPKIALNNLNAYLKLVTYYILKVIGFLHLNFLLKYFFYVRYLAYVLIMRFSPSKYKYYREWKTNVRQNNSIFKDG